MQVVKKWWVIGSFLNSAPRKTIYGVKICKIVFVAHNFVGLCNYFLEQHVPTSSLHKIRKEQSKIMLQKMDFLA
jgi:hypothetical protein